MSLSLSTTITSTPPPPHLCPISMCTTHLNVTTTCSGVIWSLLPISKCHKTSNVDEQALKHPKIQAINEDDDATATKGGHDGKKSWEKKKQVRGTRNARWVCPPTPYVTVLLMFLQENEHQQGPWCCKGTGCPQKPQVSLFFFFLLLKKILIYYILHSKIEQTLTLSGLTIHPPAFSCLAGSTKLATTSHCDLSPSDTTSSNQDSKSEHADSDEQVNDGTSTHSSNRSSSTDSHTTQGVGHITKDSEPTTKDDRPTTKDNEPITKDGRPITKDGDGWV